MAYLSQYFSGSIILRASAPDCLRVQFVQHAAEYRCRNRHCGHDQFLAQPRADPSGAVSRALLGLRCLAAPNDWSAFARVPCISIFAGGPSSPTWGHLPAAPGAIGNACVQRYLLDYRDRDHSIDSALLFAAEFKKTRRHQPEPLNSPRQCSLICVQEN